MTDMCEAFLYAAARAQHLNDIVLPALKAGKPFSATGMWILLWLIRERGAVWA